MLSEVHDLADLLEDEGFTGRVTLHLESGRVVTSVLHSLQSIENRLENEPSVLQSRRYVSCVLGDRVRH